VSLLDASAWPLGELARAWREARPFGHAAIDGLLGAAALGRVREAFQREPLAFSVDEHLSFLASQEPMQQPALQAVVEELGGERALRAVEAISGKRLRAVEGHAYFYQPGHYLLPHADYRSSLSRAVAFAYYVATDGLVGGELEFFACELEAGDVVRTEPALLLPPVQDRMVLFDVSPASLHQVREVTSGVRASIAGWFVA
jgi:Rps23 Pro-64 3,4-dihydroxylase Tpa1-like proline 4-hydroxylase